MIQTYEQFEEEQMYYTDRKEGTLICETASKHGLAERDKDGRIIIKIYLSKRMPWNELAKHLRAEGTMLYYLMKSINNKQVAQSKDRNVEDERYEENDDRIIETGNFLQDDRLHELMYCNKGWRIYFSDTHYLFMYQLTPDNLDEVAEEELDSLFYPETFVQKWYDRATGFANMNKEDVCS